MKLRRRTRSEKDGDEVRHRAQTPIDSETLRRQAAQATAERDMLQTAFSTRMAEVQRNLRAVTKERLKR